MKLNQDTRAFYAQLMKIAIPVGLQQLMVALVGASDALMLGRLSQDAVAAVSLANQINFVMNLFIGAVLGGSGALIAQYRGKGDHRMVRKLMSSSVRWSTLIALVFFALSQCIPETLMRIYTGEAQLISIGADYLRIVSWSYLLSSVTQNYLMVMKICDRAAKSAAISIMMVVVDMLADLFLIYGLCGLPKMGANGSAASTVVVELAVLVWVIVDANGKDRIRPAFKDIFSFSRVLEGDLWKIAVPMLGSSLAWGVGFSMHSVVMGHLGSDATAAASIASVTQELITCLCKGISTGAGIMVGGLLGQNKLEEAKVCGARMCRAAIWCGLLNALLVAAVSPAMMAFFVLSETAKQYLFWMLVVCAVYVFAYSLNTIIVCGVFPAGGDANYDAKSVMISMWLVSLPLAFIGAFVLDLPVMAVYILVNCDEVIKLPWIAPRYKKYIWLKNLTREEAA